MKSRPRKAEGFRLTPHSHAPRRDGTSVCVVRCVVWHGGSPSAGSISSLALAAKAQWCTVVGICGIIVSTLNCMVVYNHPAFAQAGADNPDGKQDVRAACIPAPTVTARCARPGLLAPKSFATTRPHMANALLKK